MDGQTELRTEAKRLVELINKYVETAERLIAREKRKTEAED